MTNSTEPMKNRLWNAASLPATWSLPKLSPAIAAVIVWPGSSGDKWNSAPPTAPAAIATTIVSPMARDIPRMRAATMPEIPPGNTTLNVVWVRCAPSPNDASRNDIGTARNASSATDAMIGTVSTPTAIPAASIVKALSRGSKRRTTMFGLMKAMAK